MTTSIRNRFGVGIKFFSASLSNYQPRLINRRRDDKLHTNEKESAVSLRLYTRCEIHFLCNQVEELVQIETEHCVALYFQDST